MTARITFNLIDPQLDSEELEAKTQKFAAAAVRVDEIEQADRLLKPHLQQETRKREIVYQMRRSRGSVFSLMSLSSVS